MSDSVPQPSLFYAEIPLTKGLVALVDRDLYPILSQGHWCTSGGYAVRDIYPNGQRHHIAMSHAVLDLRGIAIPTGYEVDHWNRNRTDNRTENLRAVPPRINKLNVGLNYRNTSGYPGVQWDKTRGKWFAQIGVRGRSIFLGRYTDVEEAAAAYKAALAKSALE